MVKRSLGESELGDYAGKYWNNLCRSTTSAVTCQICGKEYPELPESDDGLMISVFLGREVVEDCCGAILDRVYRESCKEFACRYLQEFADNPTDSRFYELICELKRSTSRAIKKMAEVSSDVEEAARHLQGINQK